VLGERNEVLNPAHAMPFAVSGYAKKDNSAVRNIDIY